MTGLNHICLITIILQIIFKSFSQSFINGYDSGLTALNCGVPQGSLPLLLYINDLFKQESFIRLISLLILIYDAWVTLLKNWAN